MQFLAQIATRIAPHLVRDVIGAVRLDRRALRIMGALAPEKIFLVVAQLRRRRRAPLPADLRHAENGLPALEAGAAGWGRRISKPGRGQRPFRPSVVDACEVPVHPVRGGVFVELVAHVDQMLHRCDVDIVHRRKVENDGFQAWTIAMVGWKPTAPWSGIIPRTILNRRLC